MAHRTFTAWPALAFAVLAACGSSSGSAPTLSNLVLSPRTGAPGVPLAVSASVDVADAEADVARLELSGSHSSGATLAKVSRDLQYPAGAKRATLTFGLTLSAPVAGTYTLDVQAFDSKENGSNVLHATVEISTHPSGGTPLLTALSPATASAGTQVLSLTVLGTGFSTSSVVQWNGSPRTTRFFGEGQLAADLFPSDLAVATSAQVTVATPGAASSNALTFTVTPPAALALTSLVPGNVVAGSGPFSLDAFGSGFVQGAVVKWNGSARPTIFLSSGTLFATISADDVASPGTAQVTVVNPDGAATGALTFTISVPPPIALASISPQSAFAGMPGFSLSVSGTSFTRTSVVRWNGSPRPTTFNGSTSLVAQIAAADIATGGTAQVTVVDNATGAATSALSFEIQTQPGIALASLSASDMVWDPWQRKLYLSIPSSDPVNGNSVIAFDPFTGSVTGSQFAGSEPRALALSDDGQFLYVGLDGASSVKRFRPPDLAPDAAGTIVLGQNGFLGATTARDIQVAPGAPHTVAVARTPQGGLAVYDDATARPTSAGSFDTYASVQWGADAGTIFAANNDLFRLSVSADGATQVLDAFGAVGGFASRIHFEPSTGLVYSDTGRVLDGDGVLQGTFTNASGAMVPDAALNRAYFFTTNPFGGTSNFRTFDLTRFTPADALTIQGLNTFGSPGRVVRFGSDGVAVLVNGVVALVRGSVVLPVSATPNPAPAIASLTPASAPAASANLKLTIAGTGFVPGSVVQWNGAERSTTWRSATQLVAYIPASDLSAAASSQVTVVSPAPGGGASAAATFTVGP